ncbi:GCN1 general control of amino-acid synthesis 1-like 1 (Yeast) [Seminavis robusta]|uniref:GCN1 general control of amino-acid synthesis 1-like 1 (Yeast) n=1 Tax=Seminavis robusta TaxID=568900 RepID=A0A9N8HYK8_9STRA|nr:GCN1 general control of amino-acid synthesis 1-like 1 (Yeast) [Seminavis robusta]|eukprot:Sro2013_g310990.1 GCN1 general control of amino-acid synthesis 1-like 1 (Yeast) (991) ;mRNA; f:15310-18410
MEEEEDAFGSLITLLASCRPDILGSGKRQEYVEEATTCVKESDECREYLAERCKDLECSSRHAYGRTIPLYLISLYQYKDIAKEDATEQQQATVQGLVRNLCRLVKAAMTCHSQQKQPLTQWKSLLQTTSARQQQQSTESKSSSSSIVTETIYQLAKTDKTLWSAAIALGFDLVPHGTSSYDWSTVFFEQAFNSSSLPKQLEMELLGPFLASVVSQNNTAWPTEWMDTLLLKTKANPEGGLGALLGLLLIGSSSAKPLPWQTHAEYVTPVLTKQLQSPKDAMRDMAAQIVAASPRHVPSLVNVVLPALLQSQSSTATTAPQRHTAYTVWTQLAQGLLHDTTNFPVEGLDAVLLQKLLTHLTTTLLGKEGKTATENKEAGMTAVWYWWRVAKRQKLGDNSNKAIEPVLQLIQKPITTTKSAEIVGHFLLTITDTDAVETMVTDLFHDAKNNKALEKGLDAIVTGASANKKTTTASIDGLIAVYMGLVMALSSSSKTPPAFLIKAWKASPNFCTAAHMLDAVTSNNVTTARLVRLLLPRVLALAAKWTSDENNNKDVPFKSPPVARALAACIVHPNPTIPGETATGSKMVVSATMAGTVQTVLTYQPKVAIELADALWMHVNDCGNELERLRNESFYSRDQENLASEQWAAMDDNTIRRVAPLLLVRGAKQKKLAQVLILMHVGSSLKDNGPQRHQLRKKTLDVLKSLGENAELLSSLATHIAQCAALAQFSWGNDNEDEPVPVSQTMHRAALSLMVSLGSIASDFLVNEDMMGMEDDDDEEGEKKDPADMKASEIASKLCTKEIPARLEELLVVAREKVEDLTADNVDLMLSTKGTLHTGSPAASSSDAAGKAIKTAKKKGGMSKEDEEWEEQLKKEIAAKKQKESSGQSSAARPLTADEKKLVVQQDKERERLADIVYGDFNRALAAIRYLAMSDIEVGNACLPMVSEAVLACAVSNCAAFGIIRELGDNERRWPRRAPTFLSFSWAGQG